jgi:hypothetical protein
VLIFAGRVDFILRVGYANDTFAAYRRTIDWGKSWNGQLLLLKRFA